MSEVVLLRLKSSKGMEEARVKGIYEIYEKMAFYLNGVVYDDEIRKAVFDQEMDSLQHQFFKTLQMFL